MTSRLPPLLPAMPAGTQTLATLGARKSNKHARELPWPLLTKVGDHSKTKQEATNCNHRRGTLGGTWVGHSGPLSAAQYSCALGSLGCSCLYAPTYLLNTFYTLCNRVEIDVPTLFSPLRNGEGEMPHTDGCPLA